MIRIRQLKLRIEHTEDELRNKICRSLRIREDELHSYKIRRQSLDARKKPELYYIYRCMCFRGKETSAEK